MPADQSFVTVTFDTDDSRSPGPVSSAKLHPGRGRRSNGCLTCRKRRVKCDEQRPACERCVSGYHQCLGYDKPLIWVNQGVAPDTTSSAEPVRLSRSPLRHSEKLVHRFTDKAVLESTYSNLPQSSSVPRPSATSTWLVTKASPSSTPRVVPMLSLHGFRDDIVISHMLVKLSHGLGVRTSPGDAPTMAAALHHTPDGEPSAAFMAGLGLSEAFFGKIHKVKSLVEHSALLYGSALGRLRDDLQKIDQAAVRQRAYQNLWSSVFLGMYELVAASSSSPSSWLDHARGVSALTHSMGPKAFQAPIARHIFESNRALIAISHIVERRRCFLEEYTWQTIPWATSLTPKSLSLKIQDVLCNIPGLMAAVDMMSEAAARGENVIDQQALAQGKIIDTCHQLDSLRWEWEAVHPHACWDIPFHEDSSVSVNEDGKPLFETTLQFANVERATDIVYFKTIRLMLYALSDQAGIADVASPQIAEGMQREGPFSNPLLIPGLGDRESHAIEMCRAVDYMMLGNHGNMGAFVLIFPLRVAFAHLAMRPDVRTWLQSVVFTKLTSKRGFQVGEQVLQMDSKSSPTSSLS